MKEVETHSDTVVFWRTCFSLSFSRLNFRSWYGISCEGSPSSSSVLAEAATLHGANCRSLQDAAIFYSQRRTLPSDMESESQICEMLDLLFDVKDSAELYK